MIWCSVVLKRRFAATFVRKGLCNAFDYASKGSARLALRKGQLIGDPQRTVSKLTTYVGHAR
jgi:hypothetical protein